jgi:hypothetical protein
LTFLPHKIVGSLPSLPHGIIKSSTYPASRNCREFYELQSLPHGMFSSDCPSVRMKILSRVVTVRDEQTMETRSTNVIISSSTVSIEQCI